MTRGFVSFAMLVIAAAALTTVTAERAPLGFEVEPAVMAAAVDDFQGASVADGDAGPLTFVAGGPCVLWETRTGRPAPLDDGIGKIGSSTANGDTQTFATRGAAVEAQPNNGAPDCETEPNAMAALVNVVALNPDNGGNLKAWSPEEAEPEGGIVNFETANNSNAVALTLATNGDVNVKANGGPVDTRGVYLGSFVPGEPVANVISVSADGTPSDNGTELKTAVEAAPAGTLVDIGPGTYELAAGINVPDGVTLRGAGAERTTVICACADVVLTALGDLTVRNLTAQSDDDALNRSILASSAASAHIEIVDSNLVITGSNTNHQLLDITGAGATIALEGLSLSSISHALTNLGTSSDHASSVRIRGVQMDFDAATVNGIGIRIAADDVDVEDLSIVATAPTDDVRPLSLIGSESGETARLRGIDITATAGSTVASSGIEVDGLTRLELSDVVVSMSGGESSYGVHVSETGACVATNLRADISVDATGSAYGMQAQCTDGLVLTGSRLTADTADVGAGRGLFLLSMASTTAEVGFSSFHGSLYGVENGSNGPALSLHDSVVTGGTNSVREIAILQTRIFRSTLTGLVSTDGGGAVATCHHVVTETGIDLSSDCSDPT